MKTVLRSSGCSRSMHTVLWSEERTMYRIHVTICYAVYSTVLNCKSEKRSRLELITVTIQNHSQNVKMGGASRHTAVYRTDIDIRIPTFLWNSEFQLSLVAIIKYLRLSVWGEVQATPINSIFHDYSVAIRFAFFTWKLFSMHNRSTVSVFDLAYFTLFRHYS